MGRNSSGASGEIIISRDTFWDSIWTLTVEGKEAGIFIVSRSILRTHLKRGSAFIMDPHVAIHVIRPGRRCRKWPASSFP